LLCDFRRVERLVKDAQIKIAANSEVKKQDFAWMMGGVLFKNGKTTKSL